MVADPPNASGPPSPASQRHSCVLCGRCLSVCPLYNTTGREELSPRAKFHLAQAMAGESPELSQKTALELAAKCLSCGKCEKACPFGLCAPDMLSALRAAHPGIESRLWRTWVEQAGVLWPLMATLARFSPRFALQGRYGSLLANLKGMDQRARLDPWLAPVRFEACGQGRKAVLFPGCVATHTRKDWTATAARLLMRMDFTLLPQPEFACCGTTVGHAGLKDTQRDMRLANIAAWRGADRPLLVCFCATCHHGLSAYAAHDLGWQPGERELWLAALVPLSQLVATASAAVSSIASKSAPARVHYHTPCHGAGNGHDQAMLAELLGQRLSSRSHKSLCCGFGGALKLSAPGLSDQVARRCIDFYGPLPGEQILTGCSGCVIQLKANAPPKVSVGHWLEILEE